MEQWRQLSDLRRFSGRTRILFYIILAVMAVALIVAVLDTRIGQTALLCCCGGGIALVAVGILSERGMRR